MKNYCEFKYGMVDMEHLYAELESMQYSAYFSQKPKYLCSWDKKQNIIYAKQNNSRNMLSPHIRITCDNESLNVTCQYSEAAYIATYAMLLIWAFMFFAFLLGEGDALYKIQGGLMILAILAIFALPVNKIFYLDECEDIKKDLQKIIQSAPISSVYTWEWYANTHPDGHGEH